MTEKKISVAVAPGNDQSLELSGMLDFDTVSLALQQVGEQIEQRAGQSLSLNLSKVDRSNSAALALLVECRALAQRHSTKLEFTGVPAGVLQLAEVCEADSLLAA